MSPQVSWLFFKAVRAGLAVKRPYLSHTGRASNAEKQPTGCGPEGCVENGPAAALLVGYVSIQICALLAPCRRPILNATPSPLYARRCTRIRSLMKGLLREQNDFSKANIWVLEKQGKIPFSRAATGRKGNGLWVASYHQTSTSYCPVPDMLPSRLVDGPS